MIFSQAGLKILVRIFHLYFNLTAVIPFDFTWNLQTYNLKLQFTKSKGKIIYSAFMGIASIPLIITSIDRLFDYTKEEIFGPEFMVHFGTLLALINVLIMISSCLIYRKEFITFFNQMSQMNSIHSMFYTKILF